MIGTRRGELRESAENRGSRDGITNCTLSAVNTRSSNQETEYFEREKTVYVDSLDAFSSIKKNIAFHRKKSCNIRSIENLIRKV